MNPCKAEHLLRGADGRWPRLAASAAKSDRPAGRVGSRFCRNLAGRVSTSDFSVFTDYFLVPESI